MADDDEGTVATVPCEACRGYGQGTFPDGSELDCEVCDGEGSVCAECGGSRCAWEGECVGEDDRRRADEQHARYEAKQRERNELAKCRIAALGIALDRIREPRDAEAVNVLRALRDEIARTVDEASG